MKNNIPVQRTIMDKAGAWLPSGAVAALCLGLLFATSGMLLTPKAYASEEAAQERVIQTYGPVQRGETLWHIANRFHPDRSVSIYQTMLAIIEANPEAFPTESVHDLRVGHYLEIPTGNQIRTYDAEQARRKIVPQLGGEVLSREQQQVAAETEQEVAALQEEVEAARDQAYTYARQNEELRTRIADIERTLVQLQTELEASIELERETSQALAQARTQRQSTPTSPSTEWFIQWPGVLVPMLFLLLVLLVIWGFTRRPKAKTDNVSPHKVAVAAHLQEQDAESQAASTADDDTAVESKAPASEDEAFRDIDEILAEADANPDPDSDQDAGQTPEEAEAHLRELQAGQLDLARAYIEMEDYAEARAAIDEIPKDADPDLVAEAQALLKKIKEKE
ncbi:FimV/HubP family polar landmark protein [Aliidiomarina indica]|uniref:FimV/HubP family polar landmark protein n=1 Tax=Aliidiomarina indica TaxID=2749147 RepID=UPI00188F864B|nr:FimV/HubP family polar landmark protein [Aliidiomarina indica]